jgi:hypothetical protein
MTLAAPEMRWLKTILLTQDVSLDALGRGDGRADVRTVSDGVEAVAFFFAAAFDRGRDRSDGVLD